MSENSVEHKKSLMNPAMGAGKGDRFMPKIVVMLEEGNPREVSLSKQRTTLGRRPFNDIVLNDLAVSGEHLAFLLKGREVTVEDLGSTNGTQVNDKPISKQLLQDGDVVMVGRVQIRFENPAVVEPGPAMIRVLSGASAGREMQLVKPVTTMGKPGLVVAALSRVGAGYELRRVEGDGQLQLNGQDVRSEALALRHDDEIHLSGTSMKFLQA